ncbi:hypothetical protein FGO68_gene15225 [Halteria grandinella]|uniref:Uncharacterized protein n=1 Tax=Halteria grandinella TaxID=5974 RepID=A0A8J8NEK2_HALGN|nr:hypothetical protein FGO68_gene15225 [Halteria grandinella]
MTGHHQAAATASPNNVDLDYKNHFRKHPSPPPAFINWKGENQYIWVYTRNGFTTGAYYGAFLGIASSIYARRVWHIPAYMLATGISYAAFHASSAYFRNEI